MRKVATKLTDGWIIRWALLLGALPKHPRTFKQIFNNLIPNFMKTNNENTVTAMEQALEILKANNPELANKFQALAEKEAKREQAKKEKNAVTAEFRAQKEAEAEAVNEELQNVEAEILYLQDKAKALKVKRDDLIRESKGLKKNDTFWKKFKIDAMDEAEAFRAKKEAEGCKTGIYTRNNPEFHKVPFIEVKYIVKQVAETVTENA